VNVQARNPNNARGIDCSHWQGVPDWTKVKSSGITFAILKATEGRSVVDDMVYTSYNGAKAAGMALGLYHFCRASDVHEAAAEAQFFATVFDACGGVNGLDIPPILDIETVHADSKQAITEICHTWCEWIQRKYGVTPIIYSYPSFTDDYLDASLSKYPIWMADYDGNPPKDRAGWKEWTFLQYTDKGQVPGIVGPVDLNEFNGVISVLFNKMDAKIAQDLIALCKAHYALATCQEEKDTWHARAEELRKVSGLPPDA
jgi:lysozyme